MVEGGGLQLVKTVADVHQGWINIIRINPAGTLVVTGFTDGTIQAWDVLNSACT